MKENPYNVSDAELKDKELVYTDHPAYQKPIKRSRLHIVVRAVLGWIVMIISVVIVLVQSISIFNIAMYLIGSYKNELSLSGHVIFKEILITGIILYLMYVLFTWGRHLTRPSSREFV